MSAPDSRAVPIPVYFRWPRPALLALLVATGQAAVPLPALAVAAAAAPARVALNFPDTEIDAVSRAMAALTGRPILVDPRVKGRLTLYTDDPVTPAQAWTLYVASLRGLGFAVVEVNGLRKVVPEADAKLQAASVLTTTTAATAPAGRGDTVVTQVFRIVYENASNLVPVLRPLIGANNTVNVNAGNNTLVVTDYASNLERLGTLIAALDTPSATDVEVIPLQHTQATTLVVTVQKLLDTGGAATGGTGAGAAAGAGNQPAVVLADAGLNALLVRAANPARLAAVRALVARLDQPGAQAGNVHVLYLKHAEATRLAVVLRAAFPLATGVAGAAASSGGGTAAAPTSSALPASTGGAASNASSSSTGASAEATSPVTATGAPSTGGYIQADPASNALIVTAPAPLWRELQAVIDQLDQRRAQLYVESLVAEVDASRSRDIGVKWQQILNISQDSLSSLTLGTIAQALETQAGSNILSNANVVTLDNEEAKIVVGQNVPFVTGSYTTTSSTSSNPFQTIERKDVGITLRIKPQISADGQIRLTIFQESSSVASTSSSTGPTTNKRSIETSVVVGDGRLVVLGGLIEDSLSASAEEMPVMSKVPVLGALFRANSRSRKKSNLVVFLRPHVMRDETASNRLSLDRYDLIRAQQQALPEDPREVLKGAAPPSLPPETAPPLQGSTEQR